MSLELFTIAERLFAIGDFPVPSPSPYHGSVK
jgi:hypothetical protein